MDKRSRITTMLCAVGAILATSSPAHAVQERYGQHGIFTVYREDLSCTLYADFPSGTMMRLSDRRDENRAYVNFLNANWKDLEGRATESLTLVMMFPEIGIAHVTGAQVYAPDDGRLGYAGGDLANAELLADFAASDTMVLSTIVTAPAVERERLDISGSGEAFRLMRRCSARYFPRDRETDMDNPGTSDEDKR